MQMNAGGGGGVFWVEVYRICANDSGISGMGAFLDFTSLGARPSRMLGSLLMAGPVMCPMNRKLFFRPLASEAAGHFSLL